ncbi:MAG: hypothetical protein UR85_C0001G0019 [Candidatus Nomurabacteria bacterium GW2011_GWF2_35_66]|uniref:Cohesin domain-containing protein n=1 Tax=Candidatus Nomurabacteria bacterium GW2011_GWE1_35_16 TaxID=1618761 RepID=A0A0G0BBM1_9BACT|nr:MAG: hypothetical protein UR55_C0003G0024 [Candidatus Nomurabacteria bacterium GW2011_GWF1_34_20]KKP63532.1 MAG: hypothetical protein UR57_C0003G0019 [Candidatus Nomurabacteria bacterium GW2011_GWE2_34_25]KKP66724.1 MAG: hypothetical protein UR64_C0003G0017 [Candidatus Nomurabacteria bacterium GW2011_GWE1_35_16]KKP83824.1 MAG: hypothetical protein UR85_C0001G0019 [Candidatus Nomurabacteria bacterium GW2011_GWF2_35_66]HAE36386.1 hypothetical protein [Candidatus Nomurabacteria bacterium]
MSNLKKIIIWGLVLIAFAIFAFGISDSKRISNKQELDKIVLEENAITTVTLDPESIEAKLKEDFSVKVYTDSSNGKKTCTLKVGLRFSPEQLKAGKWEFADGWLPIVQPGYDLIDNKNGSIIKTAGFPGCWTGKRLLGTITFSPKESSLGKIEVSNKTFALDDESADVYSGSSETKVTIFNNDGTTPTKDDSLPVEQVTPEKVI